MYNYCSLDQKFKRLDGLLLDTMIQWDHFCTLKIKNFWRTSVFILRPLIPCFGLLVTSALDFKARVDSPVCVLHYLCQTESSDSPLVSQLLTPWWPAWQPNCCNHILLNWKDIWWHGAIKFEIRIVKKLAALFTTHCKRNWNHHQK